MSHRLKAGKHLRSQAHFNKEAVGEECKILSNIVKRVPIRLTGDWAKLGARREYFQSIFTALR